MMPNSDKAIRLAATAAVVLLATIAFSISFNHIYDLAVRLGEPPTVAQLYPVVVDGLLLTGALVGLYCSRYQIKPPPLARAALLLGIGATVLCNWAHGIAGGLGAAIFAGWPAVALLLGTELLIWLYGASQEDRQVVVIEDKADHLSEAVTMLANNRSTSAAEVGRSLGISYPKALELTRQARAVLATAR